jgi:serine/threonine-protein kinase
MGVVHLALHLGGRRVVALKTVKPAVSGSPRQLERFLREARILGELDHPHIVAFREAGEANGHLYFAMDYVRGTDLARLQKVHGGPLPVGRAVGLICQLLHALEYAHSKKFVHRDVKPSNLLVTEEGVQEKLHLADFGLARVYQDSHLSGLTLEGERAGTPAYMAPEQITDFRKAEPAADQYATAATLYKLLTDHYVYDFPRQPHEQIAVILNEEPVPVQSRCPDLPTELAEVVHRGLAREPAERFPDVKAMRKALLPFCP